MELIATDFWMYTIIFIILGLGGFYVWMESKFRHKVIMKDVVGGRVIIRIFKAMEFTDKDKSSWWKLSGEKNKEKKLIPVPPEEVIDIDHKGKKIVQGYRFETGEIVFIRDDWSIEEPPKFEELPKELLDKIEEEKDTTKKKEILEEYKKLEIAKWKKNNKVITPFQPVTSNQRMGYFNNIKKAESRKGFDWKEKIVPITAFASLTIIIIGLMVMYGEIAAPVLDANDQAIALRKLDVEQLSLLAEIKLGIQRIDNRVDKLEDGTNIPN